MREKIILKDQYQVIWGSSEKCFCNGWLLISVVLFIALEIVISVHASNFSDLSLNYFFFFSAVFFYLNSFVVVIWWYSLHPKYISANMKWRDSFKRVYSQRSWPQKNWIQQNIWLSLGRFLSFFWTEKVGSTPSIAPTSVRFKLSTSNLMSRNKWQFSWVNKIDDTFKLLCKLVNAFILPDLSSLHKKITKRLRPVSSLSSLKRIRKARSIFSS